MAETVQVVDLAASDAFESESLVLGIDIGSSNIKTALLSDTNKIVARSTAEHCATLVLEENRGTRSEQSVLKLITALDRCIKLLPKDGMRLVKDIVVCGQMHGCVLWNKQYVGRLKNLCDESSIETTEIVSSLITWEDRRCSEEFLGTLPKSIIPLASGFGCVSLFWLLTYQPEVVNNYDSAGTIMDLVVSYLCGGTKVFISTQNACSWGYYDIKLNQWEIKKLKSANFPIHLLPTIVPPGYCVGQLSHDWHGINVGATIRVALGDMQCSILATSAEPMDAVLNIGTSAQLSIIINSSNKDKTSHVMLSNPAIQQLPYFNDYYLIVAASLNGGNVLAFFVKTLKSWLRDLGLECPSDKNIYDRLSACGVDEKDTAKLSINPVLWGERHEPNKKASVKDIIPHALSLGNIYNSLCFGLLQNIYSMMEGFLGEYKVNKFVGTGNALLKNKIFQEAVFEVFGREFLMCQDSDASVGAAMSVKKYFE